MGIIERTRATGRSLTGGVKRRIDDVKVLRRTDAALIELGRITYRQHTNRSEAADAERTSRLVADLEALEADGVDVFAVGPDAPDPSSTTSAIPATESATDVDVDSTPPTSGA
jgi:hypothetical protein